MLSKNTLFTSYKASFHKVKRRFIWSKELKFFEWKALKAGWILVKHSLSSLWPFLFFWDEIMHQIFNNRRKANNDKTSIFIRLSSCRLSSCDEWRARKRRTVLMKTAKKCEYWWKLPKNVSIDENWHKMWVVFPTNWRRSIFSMQISRMSFCNSLLLLYSVICCLWCETTVCS